VNSALRNKIEKTEDRKTLIAFGVFVGLCVAMAVTPSCSRASTTSYDVITVQLPELGYQELLAACYVYTDTENNLVDAQCGYDGGSIPLNTKQLPVNGIAWGGVIADHFEWFPSWGPCREIERTQYETYMGYTIACASSFDVIFGQNFEGDE
jgi:hypothetical protein